MASLTRPGLNPYASTPSTPTSPERPPFQLTASFPSICILDLSSTERQYQLLTPRSRRAPQRPRVSTTILPPFLLQPIHMPYLFYLSFPFFYPCLIVPCNNHCPQHTIEQCWGRPRYSEYKAFEERCSLCSPNPFMRLPSQHDRYHHMWLLCALSPV